MYLPDVAVALSLGLWLLMISVLDWRTYRIFDWASLPLAAAGLVFACFRSDYPFATHLLGFSAGYLSLALVGSLFFRLRGREGLGLGDAKLLGATGAWTGWAALPFVLLLASCSGLVQALASRRRGAGGGHIAFGPHLALSFWVVWMFGAPGLAPVWR